MDDVLGRVESRLGCGNRSSRVIAAAMAPKRRSSVQRVQEQHRLEFFENAVTTTTVSMAGVDAIGHGGSVGGMGQNPRTSPSGEAPSDDDGTERLVVCGGTEGGPSRTIEAVPGDQVRRPPVPLSVLKRAEENRAVLVRMCELRRLSHEPRASKERLRRILTDDLINHENGLAAHAQDYYSFLAGRVAKQPHLLNFQIAVLPPSRARPHQRPSDGSRSSPAAGLAAAAASTRAELSADDEAKILELVRGDDKSPALPAFRAAFLHLHQEELYSRGVEGLSSKMDDVMSAIEDARCDTQRGLQDVIGRVDNAALLHSTAARERDEVIKFKSTKRRLRDVVSDVSAVARRDGHLGASTEEHKAALETAPMVTPADLCADTFKRADEIIGDMPLNVKVVGSLNYIMTLCHTEWGHKGLFGTLVVCRPYTAWTARVTKTDKGAAVVNKVMTTAMKNTLCRVENTLRVLVFINEWMPTLLGAGPGSGRTADEARKIAQLDTDHTNALFEKIRDLGDELGGDAVPLSRKGVMLTYSELRVSLLQRVAGARARAAGESSRKTGIQWHPLFKPWVALAASTMPPRYGQALPAP